VTVTGEAAGLEQWKGRAVLAHFWATWCLPCRRELPQLERLSARFAPRGLVVVAVSIDDQAEAVRAFVASHPLPFPVLIDTTREARRGYRVDTIPVSFLIDAEGRVVERIDGETDWTSSAVLETIERFVRAAQGEPRDEG
jgi:peroxiredoxin